LHPGEERRGEERIGATDKDQARLYEKVYGLKLKECSRERGEGIDFQYYI